MSSPLTAFFECEAPTALAFLCEGGQSFFTTINESLSGAESRVRNWSGSLGRWTVDLKNKPVAYFSAVQNFLMCAGGQACAFRFLWPLDFQVEDQVIGYGDGTTTVFQLVKTYASGNRVFSRLIAKPITSDVQRFDGSYCDSDPEFYFGGTLLEDGTDYTLDQTTGLVTFTTAPAATSPPTPITWTGEFHVPVRFTQDALKAQIEPSFVQGGEAIVSWSQIELKETRDIS